METPALLTPAQTRSPQEQRSGWAGACQERAIPHTEMRALVPAEVSPLVATAAEAVG